MCRVCYSCAFGLMWLLAVALLSPVLAQQRVSTTGGNLSAPRKETMLPTRAVNAVTGKERLGEKWTDEQRIDNCKVPLDKRGRKPRPDTCPSVSAR